MKTAEPQGNSSPGQCPADAMSAVATRFTPGGLTLAVIAVGRGA
jgi:hypothetical protein